MNTIELQQHWDDLAKNDAMWAILTHKRKGGWSADEFFAEGRREIAELFACPIIGETRRFQHALDFGCGIGRLTQALAERCDRVTGVDIAPTMVATARTLNRAGPRCEYVVNNENDLRLFADENFDFIYSNIVLQHMTPVLSAGYIREFVRLLAPRGILVFQIPSRPARTLIGTALRVLPVGAVRWLRQMDMYGTPRERVLDLLSRAGATVLEIAPDADAGPHWESFRYFCTK